jgi:phosphatidylserine/phosphatidylglycerophosphate/cardiolipin synthase-like enzyme
MSSTKASKDGLSLTAYLGDRAVLLAFNIEEEKTSKLAGFAVKCLAPDKGPYVSNEYFLKNRLSFENELTSDKELASSDYAKSDKSPFQTFHWTHFPSAGPGAYRYTAYASYFKNNGAVELGPSVAVNVDLSDKLSGKVELGFTRGYISSQAYADRFGNKNIRPVTKSIDFDTTPYRAQYEWLGAHARKIIFGFLKECQQDPSIYVDVFSFDLDEVDIIDALCQLGSKVRVFQDDSSLHTKETAMEPKAIEKLKAAGVNVKTGHFHRFAHDKVMIQKIKGKATKALTGSANFSVRGLYVQANSVLVFDDPQVAGYYEKAFEEAFTNEDGFQTSDVASKWFDTESDKSCPTCVSFAPHSTPFTLDRVSQTIKSAKSSVFFALMEASGSGSVMATLEKLGNSEVLLALGTIESQSQVKLFKKGINDNFSVTSFDFLHKNVPKPFKAEWRGGPGQVIHHKFVACDFNDKTPVVFCGSSNLASGGETSNGDNLLAIYDQRAATNYTVEALRLFDTYRFRSLHERSTSNEPLMLQTTDEWTKPYFDPKNIKFKERTLLSQDKS